MCIFTGNLLAATITVNTASIQGLQGFLDFQFAGPGTPMAVLSVSGLDLHGGTLHNESLTGDASGSLTSQLNLQNTLNFPPNEDFAGVTFGSLLTLQFFFSGPAVTNPDGVSNPSTFAFSILDSTGTAPLLLQPDWAAVDPGWFGALVDLNRFGGATANSYLATGIVNTEPVTAAPEPPSTDLLAFGMGLFLLPRFLKRRKRLLRLALVVTGCITGVFGQDWAPGPSAGPSVRSLPLMAYDAARKQAVLFGGVQYSGARDVSFLTDTWVWDGSTWAQKFPLHNPPGRGLAVMAYDAARGVIVLFGGIVGGSPANDTWLWDGTDWSQALPAIRPPVRASASMTYDAAREQVVLFGGEDFTSPMADTWTWNGRNWTQQLSPNHPSARTAASFGFDANTGQVILYGGAATNGTQSDTWAWNGTSWSTAEPAHSPGPRAVAVTTTGTVTIYGGSGNLAVYNAVWVWTGSDWVQKLTAHTPTQTTDLVGSWDARGRLVLFVGADATTWIYSHPATPLTSQTRVTASPLVFSRVTGTYVGMITITNIGSTAISGPLNVLLTNLAPQLRPVNASGLNVAGIPYLLVPTFDTTSSQLQPGQSVTVQVQFPSLAFEPVAYQGLWQ